MPSEPIQIGPFIISKAALDMIIPLISVVIGGLITYLTTHAMENRKWQHQRRDKMQEQRREAISRVLDDWIDPIHSALTEASLLASGYIRKTISEDVFRKKWPDLLSELAKRDLPRTLIVLLPTDAYELSHQITSKLEELWSFILLSEPVGKTTVEDYWQRLDSVARHIENLQGMLDTLNKELIEEYKKTFQ